MTQSSYRESRLSAASQFPSEEKILKELFPEKVSPTKKRVKKAPVDEMVELLSTGISEITTADEAGKLLSSLEKLRAKYESQSGISDKAIEAYNQFKNRSFSTDPDSKTDASRQVFQETLVLRQEIIEAQSLFIAIENAKSNLSKIKQDVENGNRLNGAVTMFRSIEASARETQKAKT